MKTLIALIGAFLLAAVIWSPATAQEAQARNRYPGCAGLAAYQDQIGHAALGFPALMTIIVDEPAFETMTAVQFRTVADDLDGFAEVMDTMLADGKVPSAAVDYHVAVRDGVVVLGQAMRSMASGGVLAALAYVPTFDEAVGRIDAADERGYARCGEAWAQTFGMPSEEEGGGLF